MLLPLLENISIVIWWVPFLPLLAAFVNALIIMFSRSTYQPWAHRISISFLTLSFFITLCAFFYIQGLPPDEQERIITFSSWLSLPFLSVDWAFLIDSFSLILMLLITGFSCLILIYSIETMRHDPRYVRFFFITNLTISFLLITVMADNLLLTFLGWEGLALCSFFLIGHWHGESFRMEKGRHYFIIHRISDIGFILGILGIFIFLKDRGSPTLDFVLIHDQMASIAHTLRGTIPLLSLVGLFFLSSTLLKVGQIPFFVGLYHPHHAPFPATILIQIMASLITTSYLILRLHFVFSHLVILLKILIVIGLLTAFLAALISLAHNDLVKILSLLNISQAGFIVTSLGLSAYWIASLHLIFQVIFMTGLFLGSGVILHVMNGEHDICQMGGLKKYVPHLYWPFLLCLLALIGLFPFSGFFSQSLIFYETFEKAFPLWFIGLLALFLTSLSASRLLTFVFLGKPQTKSNEMHLSYLSSLPLSLMIPFFISSILAVGIGMIGLPQALGSLAGWYDPPFIQQWLAPVFESPLTQIHEGPAPSFKILGLSAVSLVMILSGCCVGYFWFQRFQKGLPLQFPGQQRITKILNRELYLETIYHIMIVIPLLGLKNAIFFIDRVVINLIIHFLVQTFQGIARLCRFCDLRLIDGSLRGFSRLILLSGQKIQLLQNGSIQNYSAIIFAGTLFLIFGGVLYYLLTVY
ncbi:MAG: hypothetical protein A3I75_00080 [Deltaproteobacteria bacterium RIFCSPLOWO2_02_FULL_50_16]|nr:MAG: hypothetical protein A3I75_00080 [Deltaproteobacteria bacterium RIFCSPLOWO2_02_FULL_50_16]